MADETRTLGNEESTRIHYQKTIRVLSDDGQRFRYPEVSKNGALGAAREFRGLGIRVGHPDLGVRKLKTPQSPSTPLPHPVLMDALTRGWSDKGWRVDQVDLIEDHATHTAAMLLGRAAPSRLLSYGFTGLLKECLELETWAGVADQAELIPVDAGKFVVVDVYDLASALAYLLEFEPKVNVISISLADESAWLYPAAIGETLFKSPWLADVSHIVSEYQKRQADSKVITLLKQAFDSGVIVCAATGQRDTGNKVLNDIVGTVSPDVPVMFPALSEFVIACCGARPPMGREDGWQHWEPSFWKGKVYHSQDPKFRDSMHPVPATGNVQIAAPAFNITTATFLGHFSDSDQSMDGELVSPSVLRSNGTSYSTAQVAGVAALWVERWGAWLNEEGLNRAKVFRWVLTSCGMKEIPGCGLFLDADLIIGFDLRTNLSTTDKAKLK